MQTASTPLRRKTTAAFLLSLALFFHLFAACMCEKLQTTDPRVAFLRREPREQSADTRGIEHGLGLPQAHTRRCNSQLEAAAVFGGAFPRNITAPHQPFDVQRHRRWCNAHVSREIQEGKRLVLIQVVENAGLVRTQEPPRLGIPDVPRMTGEINLRIELHHLTNGSLGHCQESVQIIL